MTLKEMVKKIQSAMNAAGAKLEVDGDYGNITAATADLYDITVTAKARPITKPPAAANDAPWMKEAKKYEGKNENDPAFNRDMSSKWKLVGLDLKTIAANWAAWCGLAAAVALFGAGYSYQKNGAAAKNWDKYGVAIDFKKVGIPRGAIVRINHKANCGSASDNHVGMSEGDCTPEDLKSGSLNVYGGNQGNAWKISSFPVGYVCAVRWPPEAPVPPAVTKSNGCKGKYSPAESTK